MEKVISVPKWFLLVLFALFLATLTSTIVFATTNENLTNRPNIAPTYALDKINCSGIDKDTGYRFNPPSGCWSLMQSNSQDFNSFWQEATKNTTFTIDGKPIEVTDVQVFYKQDNNDEIVVRYLFAHSDHYSPSWIEQYLAFHILYGNVTYYPSGRENSQTSVVFKWGKGVENSQTYVAPTCP